MYIDPQYVINLNNLLFRISLAIEPPYYPTIAGGAIRDMLLEKEVADIDVFIDAPEIKEHTLKAWFSEVEKCEHGLYEDSSFNVLYKITSDAFPVPVQIIQVKGSVEDHIKKFPTVLSRVSFNRTDGLKGVTGSFLTCATNKFVHFDQPVNYQYLDKMKQKFPDWQVKFDKPSYNPENQHALEF